MKKGFTTFLLLAIIFLLGVVFIEKNKDKNIDVEKLAAAEALDCPEYKRKCNNEQESFCRKYYQRCISDFDRKKAENN